MLDPIVNFFDKLVDQFSWRRLIFVISLIVVTVICLWIFESYTAHFRFQRIEKATELLDKLIAQDTNTATNTTSTIAEIHKGLIRELNDSINPQRNPNDYPSWYLKIVCAAVPWLFLGLMIHLASKLERGAIIGMTMVAIPICLVGAFLPTFEHHWINYIVYPITGCFLPVALIMIWAKRKKQAAE